uniref:Uncharacterized protein n=1 Tax=Caenorhabditis japonica TaxID=281687 RepID=A0A8R1E446_CAEJA
MGQNLQVFKKFGYTLTSPTYPFATLDYSPPLNCSAEVSDWLYIHKNQRVRRPKAFLPDDVTMEFVLNKYSGVSYKYTDDRKKLNLTYKSWQNIADIVTWHARDVLRLVEDSSAISMHYAMNHYLPHGARGIVLADEHPIVEVQAIQNGAAHILSIGRAARETDDISSISLVEFAQNHHRYGRAFDFIATNGAMETIGLGRFGEPLDSIGDIRMMILLGCVMKKGALMFLGLPVGKDALIFNQKRIYGHVRLPMLIAGFEWIATFSEESEMPIDITARQLKRLYKFNHLRRTLVLRKL